MAVSIRCSMFNVRRSRLSWTTASFYVCGSAEPRRVHGPRSPHLHPQRDPATLSITVFAAPPDREKLVPYREAGIHRVLFEMPDASRDEILRVLDKNAPLVAELAAEN